MFLSIFLFELKYQFRRPVTYIFWGILFAVGAFTASLLGGAFDIPVFIGGDKVFVNSPFFINMILVNVSMFFMILYIPILGRAVERDFQFGFHPLLFTTPITKFSYLFGRLSAAMIVNTVVLTGLGIGMLLANQMPWLNELRMGPFIFMGYVQPYLTHILPNRFFIP